GPLGLGPFADSPVDILREKQYKSYLEGSSYVIGSVKSGTGNEENNVYHRGEHFEDVYQIRLQKKDTINITLTQYNPALDFDLVMWERDESKEDNLG
ncbi:MAG: hypothetical protein SXQ77_02695, partial [Halobacteria archaeon]|nr:hypothetical protein [Halobacteria archaeon]